MQVNDIIGEEIPQWIKDMIQRDIEAKQKIVNTTKWIKIRQIITIVLGVIIVGMLTGASFILYENNESQRLVLQSFIEILQTMNDSIP